MSLRFLRKNETRRKRKNANEAISLNKNEALLEACIDVNKAEAVHCIKMAANLGHVNSMFNYAMLLINGDGVEVNKSEAARYFKMAADAGHIDSMTIYTTLINSDNNNVIYQTPKNSPII